MKPLTCFLCHVTLYWKLTLLYKMCFVRNKGIQTYDASEPSFTTKTMYYGYSHPHYKPNMIIQPFLVNNGDRFTNERGLHSEWGPIETIFILLISFKLPANVNAFCNKDNCCAIITCKLLKRKITLLTEHWCDVDFQFQPICHSNMFSFESYYQSYN